MTTVDFLRKTVEISTEYESICSHKCFLAMLDVIEAAEESVREYDLWSEDANDGEFRLWDLDRLVVALVKSRDALARLREVE